MTIYPRIKKTAIVVVSFVVQIHLLSAQYFQRLDSLSGGLEHPVDSVRLKFLLEYAWELQDSVPEISKQYALQGLEIAMQRERLKETMDAHRVLGSIYRRIGDDINGLDHFQKAHKIAQELGDQASIASAHHNLATIESDRGMDRASVQHCMEALKIYHQIIDTAHNPVDYYARMANSYNSLAIALKYLGERDSSRMYFHESMRFAREAGHQGRVAMAATNLANLLRKLEEFDSALYYYEYAIPLKKNAGNTRGLTHSYGNLSRLYIQTGNYEKAVGYGRRELELAMNGGFRFLVKNAYFDLARAYEKWGRYDSASHFYALHWPLNDSLNNVKLQSEVHSLRLEYETEAKEQEIATLTRENENAAFKRNILIGVIVLVVIIGFLLYNTQRLRSKRNRLLLEKEREVDLMKSHFFANISHEFRTPLTLILGPIEDLRAILKADQRGLKYLNTMKQNARRLLGLVDQLLDLSKLEAGRGTLKIAEKDIIALVRGIVMSFETLAKSRSITLEFHSSREKCQAGIDQDAFEKILINLISNAFKFTPEAGRVTVAVKAEGRKPQKIRRDHLEISVSDTGPGIEESDLAGYLTGSTRRIMSHREYHPARV